MKIHKGDLVYSHRLEDVARIKDFRTQLTYVNGEETQLVYMDAETREGETVSLLPTNVRKVE